MFENIAVNVKNIMYLYKIKIILDSESIIFYY